MNNVFSTKFGAETFNIQDFIDKVGTDLNELVYQWANNLMNPVKVKLIELCKMIKRRTQREEDDMNQKISKAKPLVHIHQEEILKNTIHKFAQLDNLLLIDFLKIIQLMMRGRI